MALSLLTYHSFGFSSESESLVSVLHLVFSSVWVFTTNEIVYSEPQCSDSLYFKIIVYVAQYLPSLLLNPVRETISRSVVVSRDANLTNHCTGRQ